MPKSSKHLQEYEIKMKEVFFLKKKKKFDEGILILKEMSKKFTNDKKILGLLGTLYYENKDFSNSSKYFKKATLINPNSELSSLGLFHSYFLSGKIILGLKEITRFCEMNAPKHYKITINELNENIDNFNHKEKKLILNLQSFLQKNE